MPSLFHCVFEQGPILVMIFLLQFMVKKKKKLHSVALKTNNLINLIAFSLLYLCFVIIDCLISRTRGNKTKMLQILVLFKYSVCCSSSVSAAAVRLVTHNTSGDTCLSYADLPFCPRPVLSACSWRVRQKSPWAKPRHVRSLLPPCQPEHIFRLNCPAPSPWLNRLPLSPPPQTGRDM